MPFYASPGIYVEEVPSGARPIGAVGTSTAGFVGTAPDASARRNEAVAVNSWSEFLRIFGGNDEQSTMLARAVYGFFDNGGGRCYVANIEPDSPLAGAGRQRSGLRSLEEIDEIAIVAAPGFTDAIAYEAVLAHCENMADRVAILDSPLDIDDVERLTRVATAPAPKPQTSSGGGGGGGSSTSGPAQPAPSPAPREGTQPTQGSSSTSQQASGQGSPPSGGGNAPPPAAANQDESAGQRPRQSDYGALYAPWIVVRDPLTGEPVAQPPSGHIAGVWARTDTLRGVHKAPANEPVRGVVNLTYRITRVEQDVLNPRGVNCIRYFPAEGIRVWGARTLAAEAGEWRYLNVRRLFNMLKESISDGTRWIVFEPNDQLLWRSIRRDIGAFLTRVWRDGALMGQTPQEAFFVKCDEETNPPDVRDAGQVVALIGVAPVKPAEFVVFKLSQSSVGAESETVGG